MVVHPDFDFCFLSTGQEIGSEEHLRNDLVCVEWNVKPWPVTFRLNTWSVCFTLHYFYLCTFCRLLTVAWNDWPVVAMDSLIPSLTPLVGQQWNSRNDNPVATFWQWAFLRVTYKTGRLMKNENNILFLITVIVTLTAEVFRVQQCSVVLDIGNCYVFRLCWSEYSAEVTNAC